MLLLNLFTSTYILELYFLNQFHLSQFIHLVLVLCKFDAWFSHAFMKRVQLFKNRPGSNVKDVLMMEIVFIDWSGFLRKPNFIQYC